MLVLSIDIYLRNTKQNISLQYNRMAQRTSKSLNHVKLDASTSDTELEVTTLIQEHVEEKVMAHLATPTKQIAD